MNAKTAKSLRRQSGYDKKEETTYRKHKEHDQLIVNPNSGRGRYRELKKREAQNV